MKRLVVKIGSNILAEKGAGLDTRRISSIARDISALHEDFYVGQSSQLRFAEVMYVTQAIIAMAPI